MVFLLGRMGDNKKALYLIIERLGDVNRVRLVDVIISLALTSIARQLISPKIKMTMICGRIYSNTRRRDHVCILPYSHCAASQLCAAFIRGLLENVGAEIDPIRLIRRIKNGLEIPGLKPALIKILQDFNLQISLLEGCQAILHGDSADLAKRLHRDQTSGFLITCELSGLFVYTVVAHESPQRRYFVLYAICHYKNHRHPSCYYSYVATLSTLVM
jgi:vacuolar protein sorting-associated protein 41